MKLHRSPIALLLALALSASVTAQVNPSITEQNIRAELGFLASDAMQGRGSGTIYERIAAEYIGSQFRQFGLEPGGDTDSAGNKGYVQRVPLESAKFVEPPTLTVITGNSTQRWEDGRDFLVALLSSPRSNGELH